jgi:thiol-disulfide isomerase/thioredoxin
MNTHLHPLLALGLVLVAPAAQAQVTPDAEVQKLIGQVAEAYRNLTALSATMEVTSPGGKTVTKFTLVKPNKLVAETTFGTDTIRVVADGTTAYSDTSRDKTKYMKQPASKFEDVVTAMASARGAGVGLLPMLLTMPNMEKRLIPGKPTSVKKIADETIATEACDVIEAVVGEGDRSSKITFAFGKQDHLLRRLALNPVGVGGGAGMTETYTDVTLQPSVTDTTFKYTPASGAVAVDPPKEPERFDPRLKVGAVPLAISGKDLAGKPVTLAQYKGKVLLIDFWATWCGPCVAEMPNVIAAYKKYHAQGFEILGVSLDQANSKDKLTAFMTKNKMTWRQIYDGKYWQAANAQAYGVQSIPFTLLIGKDGKIAAVAARGEELAPAIAAALKKP